MLKHRTARPGRSTRTSAAAAAMARPAVVLAAAAAASLAIAGPAQAHPGEHTVVPGDTLGGLAAAHGTSWQTIHADNLATIGADPNVLRVGQVLVIGGSGAAPAAPAPAGGEYVVQPGDTLGGIAARHGTTWQDVHALNLEVIGADPNVLRVGQRLTLVGGPSAAPERASRAADRPALDTAAYGAWEPHVRPAVAEVAAEFGIPTVLTRPGHSPSEGRAADFMVYDDRATGDALSQYVIDNAARLGVEYVIWQQQIAGTWTGWAWQPMEDRGSPTANHMDHPHVAFVPAP
ncbi:MULTISPECIES: LysM peptidoglycan-binding domain-containing protein [unclassified Blastococcus]